MVLNTIALPLPYQNEEYEEDQCTAVVKERLGNNPCADISGPHCQYKSVELQANTHTHKRKKRFKVGYSCQFSEVVVWYD